MGDIHLMSLIISGCISIVQCEAAQWKSHNLYSIFSFIFLYKGLNFVLKLEFCNFNGGLKLIYLNLGNFQFVLACKEEHKPNNNFTNNRNIPLSHNYVLLFYS